MSNLNLLDEIFHLRLRPWLGEKYLDTTLRSVLAKYHRSSFLYDFAYEYLEPKPQTRIQKMYGALLRTYMNTLMQKFHAKLIKCHTDPQKQYFFHTCFHKILVPYLSMVIDTLKTPNALRLYDKKLESYVFNYAANTLVWSMLEAVHLSGNVLQIEMLNLEEFLKTSLKYEMPVNLFKRVEAGKKVKPKLHVCKKDLFPTQHKFIHYKGLVNQVQAFAALEMLMFNHGLIDHQYMFIAAYGNKQIIAAAYHVSITNGYFNSRIIQSGEHFIVKPNHIRKYLDSRYSANTEKQFRYWKSNPTKLNHFLLNHSWLKNLPAF